MSRPTNMNVKIFVYDYPSGNKKVKGYSPRHVIFGMGDKISNDSWKYKYESTAAAGGTVFMRLTKAWKDAHHTEKWHGGR